MSTEWSSAYEAPTSLDAGRILGARPMRPTLWMFLALIGSLPIALSALMLSALVFVIRPTMEIDKNIEFENLLSSIIPWLIFPTVLLALFCMIMANDWARRPAEHWFRVWIRHRRLPKQFNTQSILNKHHVNVSVENSTLIDKNGIPSAVVEVSTLNLRMTDDEIMSGHIKKLHSFYVGLRFPIQIVIRSWMLPDNIITRRWFVAVMAPTPELLDARITDIVAGLKRAGLSGRPLNGDLFNSLQACWTHIPNEKLGPRVIKRHRTHVEIDGEFVRGFVLSKIPRIVDANWMYRLLDGDLPVDISMWLDPIDNVEELDNLSLKINAWETAQILQTNQGSYRDPDIDDQITDAKRTRGLLRQPGKLRVFFATIGLVARGATLDEMQSRERQIIDLLREHIGPDPVLAIDYEHDRAPLFAVPTGMPPIEYPLRMVTPMLARTYPFSSSSLTMVDGVRCGTSKGSQRENFLNVWLLINPHMFIPATSGAGKGYWIKVFLWRMMQMWPNRRVWIIQAEKDEYSALADAMPKNHRAESTTEPIYLTEHPQAIQITNSSYWPESFEPGGDVIRIPSLDKLKECVYIYAFGKPVRLAGSQLTVYDLTRMPPAQRGQAIAEILEILETCISNERQETLNHVLVDELGIVLRSKEAAAAIETGYRRFRSLPHRKDPKKVSRIGMIGISQRPSDVLHHEIGKVIADLSETHLYLRQKTTELRSGPGGGTAKVLNLNKDEQEYLELAEDGDALLVAGRHRVGLHLHASSEEHEIAKT